MKTLYKVTCLCLVIVFSLSLQKAAAQFSDATITEYAAGATPVDPNNTGNDILDLNGWTYEVSVWDDNNQTNAGICWKVNNTYQGHTLFAPGNYASDPDVCLIDNGAGLVFAIAVYHVGGGTNQFYWETFQWSGTVNSFATVANGIFDTGPFGTTVNIDGNANGDFAIIWDTPAQQIRIVTGSTLTTGLPFLNNTAGWGSYVVIGTGKNPDACIFQDPNTNQAEVAFINSAGRVVVNFHRIIDLKNGIGNPLDLYISPQADYDYYYPRIACPNAAGSPNDWTIVVEDNDGSSSYLIRGTTSYTSATNTQVFQIVYNDGTSGNSPFNISDYPNTRPVVAYDNTQVPWIGWTMDNSFGLIGAPGAYIATYPISIICDKQGQITANSKYLTVPTTISNLNTYSSVSISGRNSTKSLYTFYNAPQMDVLTKTIPQSPLPGALKSTTTGGVADIYSLLNAQIQNEKLNPENFPLTFSLYDLSGRKVISHTGTAKTILDILTTGSEKIFTGICLANIISADGKINVSGKITLHD